MKILSLLLVLISGALFAQKEVDEAIKKLQNPDDWEIRAEGANILGEMGPKAKKAVPFLMEALKDKSKDVRFLAIVALQEIGKEASQAIPILIQYMFSHPSDANGIVSALTAITGEYDTTEKLSMRLLKRSDYQATLILLLVALSFFRALLLK